MCKKTDKSSDADKVVKTLDINNTVSESERRIYGEAARIHLRYK